MGIFFFFLPRLSTTAVFLIQKFLRLELNICSSEMGLCLLRRKWRDEFGSPQSVLIGIRGVLYSGNNALKSLLDKPQALWKGYSCHLNRIKILFKWCNENTMLQMRVFLGFCKVGSREAAIYIKCFVTFAGFGFYRFSFLA